MTSTSPLPVRPWSPAWWTGPTPLLVAEPDDWDRADDHDAFGRAAALTDSGESVRLGSVMFRFRDSAPTPGGIVFHDDDPDSFEAATRNRKAGRDARKSLEDRLEDALDRIAGLEARTESLERALAGR